MYFQADKNIHNTVFNLERNYRIYFYKQSARHIFDTVLYAISSLKHIIFVFSYETLQKCRENYSDLFNVLVFRTIYVFRWRKYRRIYCYVYVE